MELQSCALAHNLCRSFASVGAFITIASLTIDTLTQNVVHVSNLRKSDPVSDTQSWVPRSKLYSQFVRDSSGNVLPSPAMVASITSGLWLLGANEDAISPGVPFSCPTSDCEFDDFESLGVCLSCEDASSAIEEVEHGVFSLPDGLTLNTSLAVLNMTGDLKEPFSLARSTLGPLIVRTSGIADGRITSKVPGAFAMECALFWCLDTYNATVNGSSMNETRVQSRTNISDGSFVGDSQSQDIYLLDYDDCKSANCTNFVDSITQQGLQSYLTDVLTGEIGCLEGRPCNVDNLFMWSLLSVLPGHSFNQTFHDVINNLALSMSRNVRQQWADTPMGFNIWQGRAYKTEACFQTRWRFIIFPCCVVVLGAVFLAGTMILNGHTEVWKDSPLALLFHGLSAEHRSGLGSLPSIAEMDEVADSEVVHLGPTYEGLKLVRRN